MSSHETLHDLGKFDIPKNLRVYSYIYIDTYIVCNVNIVI